MKIKVPKEIKLLSHTYQVRSNTKELISAGAMGLTRHLFQWINVDTRNVPPTERDQTLLHELFHVIERHFNLKIEDEDIDRFSEGFASILFDSFGIKLDWSDIKEE